MKRETERAAQAAGEGPGLLRGLKTAEAMVHGVLDESRSTVETAATQFGALAASTDTILCLAETMIRRTESGDLSAAIGGVRKLGSAAEAFLRDRLEGAGRLLEIVAEEESWLARLGQLTRSQKTVVRETEMLRVLTNIEVARLGEVGAGFQYLARELEDFVAKATESLAELTQHTESRRAALAGSHRNLTAQLPRMRQTGDEAEAGLREALELTAAAAEHMRAAPERFRGCVEEIAAQVTGVVAAIQSYDITRQQMEHVRSALRGFREDDGSALCGVGLRVQMAQLRNIRATASGWTEQMARCLDAIARVAAGEIAALGPELQGHELALTEQLERMHRLEQASLAENEKLRQSLSGMEGLMQLVGEHLERSRAVRERLQLLMFNSIVEANHLGAEADGIVEISRTIKRTAAIWIEITGRAEAARREIEGLVEKARGILQRLAASEGLEAAHREAAQALDVLRGAAEHAARQGGAIERALDEVMGKLAEIARGRERLDREFGRLEPAIEAIDPAQWGIPDDMAGNAAELERTLAADYTTEAERAVLHAALLGQPAEAAPLPAGNEVELF